ncbi:hypothetical protein TD95_001512 [Thielaviopsis punctulata]|uniref:adenosine deaminase n=1 Tax=Thielaviopsis punctulata TaxID=72032 RepID=A0A0F4ZJH0_9PEZI|nr:hypothetical protein TD95_001512 [Thielaviopsis punctulata]
MGNCLAKDPGEKAAKQCKPFAIETTEQYKSVRDSIVAAERKKGFQLYHDVHSTAEEKLANTILQNLRQDDVVNIYNAQKPVEGVNHQIHHAFPGDRFLNNKHVLERTKIFRVLKHMPKGGHLHIHFNAALEFNVLLDIAKEQVNMCVKSVYAKTLENGALGFDLMPLTNSRNAHLAEIQFQIQPPSKPTKANIFHDDYARDVENEGWMNYLEFRAQWVKQEKWKDLGLEDHELDLWLKSKLHFSPAEMYSERQTVDGAWTKFNGRTRMMKGLFNYEQAYITYTDKLLEYFVDNNIQYAEIRPNFMANNQLFDENGIRKVENSGIMDIIIQRFEKFNENRCEGTRLQGLKVIYCFPRSFSPEKVAAALKECLAFKKNPTYAPYIAGFDLVGEEGKGRPLKDFSDVFLAWRKDCTATNVDIPLLLHCGETLETGTDTDENLIDALVLGARRIGHGYALPRHPVVLERMKENNVCIELCPISNEILGLTPRILGHSMYTLLAHNVPCTVSSDNEAIFQSTLAHDFYQVFIGQKNMDLFGLKQLVTWSIDHAVFDKEREADRKKLRQAWAVRWKNWVQWIIKEYGSGKV